MTWNNKVIWTEGMFLRPTHFQQQERYFEFWVESRCRDLQPFAWGLIHIEIDRQLLGIGKFALLACQGVFPDGTPFSMPDHYPLPDPIDIAEDIKDQLVYLALPVNRINALEINWGKGADVDQYRFGLQEVEVKDTHSQATPEPAEVQIAPLAAKLRLANQHLDAFVTIPIAKISERKADKMVLLQEQYLPTCLIVSASTPLNGYVQEIEGILQHRATALAQRLATPGAGGVAEIVDFLLLLIVNRYLPLFNHLVTLRQLHPERLYSLIVQMIGELSTITQANHLVKPLPKYLHEDLTATFVPLMAALREVLSWVSESRAIRIPLEQHPHVQQIYTGIIADRALLHSAEFILAVNAQIPTEVIRAQLPRQTAIATAEKLRDLVMAQVPGIRLSALNVAPRQIPIHQGMTYFALDKKNELWKDLEKSGTLAMHFSGNYPGLELEFWAIRA